MGNILRMEFYNVTICDQAAVVSKEFFVGQTDYNIKFINNKKCDFINTFDAFGFSVFVHCEEDIIKLFGKLQLTEAKKIISQIQKSNFVTLRNLKLP